MLAEGSDLSTDLLSQIKRFHRRLVTHTAERKLGGCRKCEERQDVTGFCKIPLAKILDYYSSLTIINLQMDLSRRRVPFLDPIEHWVARP